MTVFCTALEIDDASELGLIVLLQKQTPIDGLKMLQMCTSGLHFGRQHPVRILLSGRLLNSVARSFMRICPWEPHAF